MRLQKIFKFKTKTPQKRNINIIKKNIVSMANALPVMDEWLEQEEIDIIDADASVISSVSLRKSATLKKEMNVLCDDDAVKKALEKSLDFTFRQQALDTPLQGFTVFELDWYQDGALWIPVPVERNYQDFKLQGRELWYIPNDIKVPPYKTIHAAYSPKFNKPMGRPLYKTLFWLVKFKNASIDFWLEYMERFSSPWIVGSTEGDKDEMAENLYAMLAGDVAVIEEDDKVELITPDEKGNFHELSKYADDQIRETLVGSNILGSASGGSYAASKEQNRVREDVAMTDEKILKSLIDQTIDAFVTVNNYTKPVSVELKDEDDINKDLSDRDLNIFKMSGEKFRPTQEYLEETYKIKLEEIPQPEAQNTLPNTMRFSNSDPKADHISEHLPPAEKTQPVEEEILQKIEQIFETAQSYEEAFDALAAHYVSFDAPQLEAMLSDYIANAHLYGLAEVEDENPKG